MKMIRNLDVIQIFTILGLSVVGFGYLALLLAIFGLFYQPILLVFLVLELALLTYLVIINKKNFKFSRIFIIILISSVIFILILSYFTTPSIFSGRDQGSLSNAAISLSKNHNLESSFPAEKEFFKIYGPGTALNFPGFNYNNSGNLVTHLPLGYTSWLAAFYSIFGLYGFIIANALTFFLFLISFYLLSKNYLHPKSSLIAFLLILSCFSFSWFFKYTLSENLALGLIWFGLLQFIYFLKEKRQLYLISFILSFGLLLFVRIEATAFLVISLVILYFEKDRKNILKNIFRKSTLLLLLAIFLIFIYTFKVNSAFYINVAKGFIHSLGFYKNDTSSASHPFLGAFYILRVLSSYTLINYILLSFAGFIYFIKIRKIQFLIPYLILLPAFSYLINPSISLDHPWMLRRYLFAVIPISILYTVIFLENFIKKKVYFYILLFFLLLTNLLISFPYITVKENKELLSQIKNLSSDFGKNDLILVDRSATGDPWSMLTGPMNLLYEKQAVYFFNPDDLKKIDQTKFDKIYLIIPDFNLKLYSESWLKEKLVFVKNYVFENSSLNIIASKKDDFYKNPVLLPIYQKNYTYGKIYLIKN